MNDENSWIKDEGAMGDDCPSVIHGSGCGINNEQDWGVNLLKEAFFCVHEIERLLKSVTDKLIGQENGP